MSFIGTLVVWQRPTAGMEAPEVVGDFEEFQTRGGWTVSYLDDELVGTGARPLLDDLCAWTRSPVLTTFIFESDCGFVSASDLSGAFWSGCLARNIIASLDSLDEQGMLQRYGSASDAASHAVSWARNANLEPNSQALSEVFALSDEDTIFLGLVLFDRMLDALGLPTKAEPDFYNEPDE